MSKLTINWMEQKTITIGGVPKKLIEGTFKNDVGAEIKATIWREDKNGGVFPNFDTLAPGHEIEAEPWQHPTKGTYTLYPPRNFATGRSGGNKANIQAAQERKEVSINKAQDRKEESIEKAACQRDAVLLTTTFYKDLPMSDQDIAEKIEYWRGYLQSKLEAPF